jgi:hypothetical protein
VSFELPFPAAARQWRVLKVVGRSAVIWNVPLSGMCRYLECAVLPSVAISKDYFSNNKKFWKELICLLSLLYLKISFALKPAFVPT